MTKSSHISTEENSSEGLELECDEIAQQLDFATNPNFEQDLEEEFFCKIRLLPTSALVCLRMVMKFSESQQKLYGPIDKQESERNTTPYQEILNELVNGLIECKSTIWGDDFGLELNLSTAEKNS